MEENEMLEDIRMMLVTIKAFTKEDTKGEDLLKEWDEKYGEKQKSSPPFQSAYICSQISDKRIILDGTTKHKEQNTLFQNKENEG